MATNTQMASLRDSQLYMDQLREQNETRARQIADKVADKIGYTKHVEKAYEGMHKGMHKGMQAKGGGEKSKKLFDKIDTNKSGTISLKEFTKYCKKRGMSLKKSKKLFKKHDKNGDKKLSRKEFSKIKFRKAKSVKKH